MKKARISTSTLLLASLALTFSNDLMASAKCHTNRVTDAMICYTSVTEIGSIRRAKMAVGGPNGVRENGHSFAVNCETGVIHIKDADGVSYGAGGAVDTEATRNLARWICEEPIKRKR